jgi:transcriptional regulator with XRE-family HTH domain
MNNTMPSQPDNDGVLAHVAGNMKRIRQMRAMSQAALADASGLSRRMIVALESGGANISLSSLDRIAAALGVSFVDLVASSERSPQRIEALAWRGGAAESRALLLGSVPATSEAQLWAWTLGVGERYPAEPDPAGWHEMVYVIEGELRIELAAGAKLVAAGDFAIYPSDQIYAYVNVATTATRFIRTVVS